MSEIYREARRRSRDRHQKEFYNFLYSQFSGVNTAHHTGPHGGSTRVSHRAEGVRDGGEQWARAFSVISARSEAR